MKRSQALIAVVTVLVNLCITFALRVPPAKGTLILVVLFLCEAIVFEVISLHCAGHDDDTPKELVLTFYYRHGNRCIFSDGYTGPAKVGRAQHLIVNADYVCLVKGSTVESIQWSALTETELEDKRLQL